MHGWRRTRYEFFFSPSVPPWHPLTRWVKRQVHYAQLDPWKTRWDNKSICSRRWLPISELSLASFLKRVPVLILSYDYKFLFTYKLNLFSYEWLSTRSHLEIEPKGASEMANNKKETTTDSSTSNNLRSEQGQHRVGKANLKTVEFHQTILCR